MTSPRSMLSAAVLAAPLSALSLNLPAGSAQAADIIDTLKEQQQFSTLAKAIDTAGLAESLQGEGPYTVFAPTDQAFDQLPQDAVESLMKEENRDQLEALLAYHVIEGEEITAKDATGKQTHVDTVSGDRLSVDGTGQMVLVMPSGQAETQVTEGSDMPSSPHQEQVLKGQQPGEQQAGQQGVDVLRKATVIEPDIQADNGVIHGIDAVLIPQSVLSLIEQSGSQQGDEQG